MATSPFAQQALTKMTDEQLQRALAKLSGPILRELARRGYDVTLAAPAIAVSRLPCVHPLYEFSAVQAR